VGKSFENWKQGLLSVTNDWPEQHKQWILLTVLVGDARSYYSGIPNVSALSFDEVMEQLTRRFEDKESRSCACTTG